MTRILAAVIAAAFAFTAVPAFSQSNADKAEKKAESGAKKTKKKAQKSAHKANSKAQHEAGKVEGRAEQKKADSK